MMMNIDNIWLKEQDCFFLDSTTRKNIHNNLYKKIVADRPPSIQDILGRRKIRMIDLTDDERNISPELTNDDVYIYLGGAKWWEE